MLQYGFDLLIFFADVLDIPIIPAEIHQFVMQQNSGAVNRNLR
jgi:hypothetical protein